MAQYKSAKDFVRALNRELDRCLNEGITEIAKNAAVVYADKYVYNKYEPKVYKRRYSLKDREQWETQLTSSGKKHTLAVYSTAKPNPYLNGTSIEDGAATEDKSLPELIELGHKKYTSTYGGHGYDIYSKKGKYYKARKFSTKLVSYWNKSRVLNKTLEQELANRGYEVQGLNDWYYSIM